MNLNKLKFLYRASVWAIILLMFACIGFAYLSANAVISQQEKSMNQQANQVITAFNEHLNFVDSELNEHVSTLAKGDYSNLISSTLIESVSLAANNATPIVLFGKANHLPSLNAAQAIRLNQGKSTIIAEKNQSTTQLYLAKLLPHQAGYIMAQINMSNFQDAHSHPLIIHLINQQLVIANNQESISNNLMQYILKSNVNEIIAVNGYRFIQKHLNLVDRFGLPNATAIHFEKKPSLIYLFLNYSDESILIFISLVLLFSAFYAKNALKHQIKLLQLQGHTMPLEQRFSSYLNAVSNLDKAIMAGVDIDEVCTIALSQIQSIFHAEFVGLTMLPTRKQKEAITTLLHKNAHVSQLTIKVDKALVNKLEQIGANHGLNVNSNDYQLFNEISAQPYRLFVHPIYNDGLLAGFVYIRLDKHRLNDIQENCLKNIAQHLGVAFSTIANNEKLYIKQYFDPVTELYNQQACRERLSQEFSSARRRKGKVAVFHIKLMGYKKINESFGYAMGDQLLKAAGIRLKDHLRDSDIIARLGSDDFIIATSDISIITNANRLADKVSLLFNEPIQIYDNSFNTSTAIGISTFPHDGMTVDEVLNNANAAMSKAKALGNGHYAFYEDNLSTNEMWRINLDKDLRKSLSTDQVFMYYQAQVNPRNKKLCGVEALMRWKHPTRGLINPAEFIQLAEETGLIVSLGQYARKTAFKQYMAWQKMNCAPEKIAVNVSSYEMQRQEFVAELKSTIDEIGINPHAIELEITESLLIEISGNVVNNLQELNEMGIAIAIDDFGTGYSNLSYLGRLPFDVLKIDKSFMHGVGLQSNANQIVSMMIDMAHHLGKSVCAEGVETDTQLTFLEAAGCDVIQGYLISKPVSADDFAQFALNQKNHPAESAMLLEA